MKKFFILITLFTIQFCVTVDENFQGKARPIDFNICFWRGEAISSQKVIEWRGKKNYFEEVLKQCDSFAMTEVDARNTNLASDLEESFSKLGLNYRCADSFPKLGEFGESINPTKYINCVNNNKVIEMNLLEYPDLKKDFYFPQTFYFMELTNGAKISILPFHARPGNKNELIDFENIVNFSYQKYSERKAFFGGDFYIDNKYHSDSFLKSLLYFRILKNLITEPSTSKNEKNDAIFTDTISSLNCSGKVLDPAKFFPDLNNKNQINSISTHWPIMAQCKIR